MDKISARLNYIKNDLYGKSSLNTKCSQFFKRSILHIAISLEVGTSHFNDEVISYEIICKNIPTTLGSRSSIQSILNTATHNGYFIKKELRKDKRVKTYSFSEEYESMIINWVDNQRKDMGLL